MLPGGGDGAADFMKNGFIKEMELSRIRADVVAVDAHLGYYFKRNLIPRLYEDIIFPAKQNGYKNIWLLGISMGGLGAVIYAKHYPGSVTGLILLAPFLGYPAMIGEISSAGGLSKWSPTEPIDKDDYEHLIWKWLKGYTIPDMQHPRLLVGYGSEDRFAKASSLLAEIIPKDQVYMISGGHDWDTWGRIFYQIIQLEFMLR
jgi:pimeloyl-ACP methyl ester carboxylesterase